MNDNDRRVMKTKKSLQSALARLLNKKELHLITVKELTIEADVHRATFYTHYKDIYDLYEQMEDGLLADLREIMSGSLPKNYRSKHEMIVDYVYSDTELAAALFGKTDNKPFLAKVYELLEQEYLEMWKAEDGLEEVTEEIRYITTYHIQGSMAVIARWVAGGFKDNKEEIIEMIRKLDMNVDKL